MDFNVAARFDMNKDNCPINPGKAMNYATVCDKYHSISQNTPSNVKKMSDVSSRGLLDRSALVTGSSRGIGKAIAEGLRRCGASVMLHASSMDERLEEAAVELAAIDAPGRIASVAANLADPAAPQILCDTTRAALGRIDILVLNASVQIRNHWLDVTAEEFDMQVAVNVRSSLCLMQQAVPEMKAAGWGRVLTLGSVQQDRPAPPLPVYAATKAALMNLVRTTALDLAPHGITVNCLSPGLIETDRNLVVRDTPEKLAAILERVPVGFVGQPGDCVGAALLLCSDAGRYVTGADWRIDGGWGLK